MSNFDYGSVLTEFVLLGNVATQFDRPMVYDPVNMDALVMMRRQPHCTAIIARVGKCSS